MAEVTIPKEKMNYTIDLLITMVTDEIAEETGKDRKEILTDFLCSKTGKALYDAEIVFFLLACCPESPVELIS